MTNAITIAILTITLYYATPILMCQLETTPCYINAYVNRHETHRPKRMTDASSKALVSTRNYTITSKGQRRPNVRAIP